MKAVVLGGTFNPVHNGHLFIAEEVRVALGYDTAIFVPANQPVHKDLTPVLPAQHRLAMLRLGVDGHEGFIVDAGDIERGGPSYSIDSVACLIPRYGIEGKPGFLIGDDLAAGFPSWKNVEELVRIVDVIIARRTRAEPVPFSYPHRSITNILLPLSSSEIRRRIAEHRTVRYLVPDAVLAYIRDNALYER